MTTVVHENLWTGKETRNYAWYLCAREMPNENKWKIDRVYIRVMHHLQKNWYVKDNGVYGAGRRYFYDPETVKRETRKKVKEILKTENTKKANV